MSLSAWIGPLFVEALEGEAGCFLVHSGSNVYRVDITFNHCVGKCGCDDYLFNRNPKEREAIRKMPDKKKIQEYRCKHIKAVHYAIGLTMVDDALRIAYMNMNKNERSQENIP